MRILKNSEIVEIAGASLTPIFSNDEGVGFSVSGNSVITLVGYSYYAFHVTDPNNNVVYRKSGNLSETFFNEKIGRICEVECFSNGSQYYYFN